jgi:hypothetical protein
LGTGKAGALRAVAGKPVSRRGVVAVVSMMFLILFGSLAAAMAIASKGNIRTASTHVHVMRALSAAETGMEVATARLSEAAGRFVVSRSTIDATSGAAAWNGNISSFGTVTVLPPPSGFSEGSQPFNIAQALANQHAADQNIVTAVGISTPVIGNAMAGVSLDDYAANGWLYTPAVSLESGSSSPACFQITYAPLANGTDVRVIVTGYDYGYTRNGEPLQRTIMQDFRMIKRVNQAIISPTKIMIGKNVMVSGDLGARFNSVSATNGDPAILRSDFLGLHPVLDQKLNAFFAAVRQHDVDGDNRLRVGHPTERAGIPSGLTDYNGDGQPDNAFDDVTRDGYVDDFDIFIKHFDANRDGKVALSGALTAGTPNSTLTEEFVLDEDLALLIDSSRPDRNKNGVHGFVDTNNNGRWDTGESFLDSDVTTGVNRDQVLGYRDGVIDYKDQYAKIAGRLIFRTTQQAWAAAQGGGWRDKLAGAIRPGGVRSATLYGASETQLPSLPASGFDTARSTLASLADGQSFAQQVASQLGVSAAQLATYVETEPEGSTQARFIRLDPDANNDGRPDNWLTAYFEKMPFNSPNFSDWYYRPVYENMVFKDVVIPAGTNALFKNCTFVGVTYVQTTSGNNHVLWSEYGKMQLAADGKPEWSPRRYVYGDDAGETSYPASLPSTARPPEQLILMALSPMDKADLTAAQAAVTQGFNLLPNPLILDGKRVTDTKLHSNNLRFHDCLFVGSIVSDNPGTYTQARNKIQFTGGTRFSTVHPERPDDTSLNPSAEELVEIRKSSMMLPNYSVDIGSFNSPPTQNVRLQGAIVAGVLDARGNTSINGALLLTFTPTPGQAPMIDALGNPMGNPAGFNTTLGYFGPADGDNESLDPATLPTYNGTKIVGWDTNGDGLADLPPSASPPVANAVAVPFYGYGRIDLRFDPTMALPDGVPLPLQFSRRSTTYREGRP